jgi:isopentenyl-diphosphate Delta-isomerase
MALVELVNSDGMPVGSATVDQAHRAPGLMHRAFSVFLRDESGRVLLQQRAAVKTRFPLRWGNTCCGHPGPGEQVTDAAARRLGEEIGVDGVRLTELGVYTYYAEDPDTGRVEYEYDHVLIGDFSADAPVHADPQEVADLRWVTLDDLRAAVRADGRSYAPWLAGVTDVLASSVATANGASSPPAPTHLPAAFHLPAASTPVSAADGSSFRAQSSSVDASERSGGG